MRFTSSHNRFFVFYAHVLPVIASSSCCGLSGRLLFSFLLSSSLLLDDDGGVAVVFVVIQTDDLWIRGHYDPESGTSGAGIPGLGSTCLEVINSKASSENVTLISRDQTHGSAQLVIFVTFFKFFTIARRTDCLFTLQCICYLMSLPVYI